MNRYTFLLCFFALILLSCSQNNPKDIQNEVFKDIFSELIENSTQDYRKMTIPSPELIKIWKQGNDVSKKNINDNRKMLVVINDSISMPVIPKNANINIESYDPNTLYKFDFYDFSFNADEMQLISNKDYNENPRKKLDEYYFGGFLDISQIFFVNGLNEAHLFVQYRLGKSNSQKSKIYIKKFNKKWSIIKTELINLS